MITPDAFDLFDTLIDEDNTGLASRDVKARFVNLAIRDIIEDRIRPKDPRKNYSLQSDLRSRGELAAIYKKEDTDNNLTISNGVISLPQDFKYPVYLLITNQKNKMVPCVSVPGHKASENRVNPFIDHNEDPYFEQMEDGLHLYTGQLNYVNWYPTIAELYYLTQWTEVYQGPSNSTGDGLIENDLMYVESGSITYPGGPYDAGTVFTATTQSTFSGGVVSVIRNCEIGNDLMRECVRQAAAQYMDSMDEVQKAMDHIGDNFRS